MSGALLATAHVHGPHVDWAGLSPLVALLGGAVIVLMAGLLRARIAREVAVPLLALTTLGAAIGCAIWQWGSHESLISGALRLDPLTLVATLLFCAGGAAAVLLSWEEGGGFPAPEGIRSPWSKSPATATLPRRLQLRTGESTLPHRSSYSSECVLLN